MGPTRGGPPQLSANLNTTTFSGFFYFIYLFFLRPPDIQGLDKISVVCISFGTQTKRIETTANEFNTRDSVVAVVKLKKKKC